MTKGQRIKQKREAVGISQTDLAKKIGVSKQTLYKYENDIITNIPSDVIEKIAQSIECTPDYIMGWDSLVRTFKANDPNTRINNDLLFELLDSADELTTIREPSPEEIQRALKLYNQYKKAIPQVQNAVDALLKPQQPDA